MRRLSERLKKMRGAESPTAPLPPSLTPSPPVGAAGEHSSPCLTWSSRLRAARRFSRFLSRHPRSIQSPPAQSRFGAGGRCSCLLLRHPPSIQRPPAQSRFGAPRLFSRLLSRHPRSIQSPPVQPRFGAAGRSSWLLSLHP